MNWIVKIEDKASQRIVVFFDPIKETIKFYGEYKPKNEEWICFSKEKCPMNTDLDVIKEKLLKTYDLMKKRIDAYVDITKSFSIIRTIEIQEDKLESN